VISSAARLVCAALPLAGCSLFGASMPIEHDENWRMACRISYYGLGRTTTVYIKMEPHVHIGNLQIDDQCKITIQSTEPRGGL
jgi:hypothetical protein